MLDSVTSHMFEIKKIKKLEEEAAVNIEVILKESMSIDGQKLDKSDWEKHIDKIKLQYTTLKEKLKHDKKKLLEIAVDWKDFTELLSAWETSWEIATAGALDREGAKLIEEDEARIGEIEKRFSLLLE